MGRDYYTRYPRPILWLIPGGSSVKPFYLSKLPVTNEQYRAFDAHHESNPAGAGDRDPVTGVSRRDAEAYCRWYAGVARKPIRLPTEDEWEHACRAGSAERWTFEDSEADRHLPDLEATGGRLLPLEDFPANPHGLYGMLGGVWEWVGETDEREPPDAGVLRGGSYRTPRAEIGCSSRRLAPPDLRAPDVGFRIAKSLSRP